MASKPPFLLEDNTDEDFFDKLVNDDDDFIVADRAPQAHPNSDGNESDEVKVFEKLSINELGNNGDIGHDNAGGRTPNCVEKSSTNAENVQLSSGFGAVETSGNLLVSMDPLEFNNLPHQLENVDGVADASDLAVVNGEGVSDISVLNKSRNESLDTTVLSKSNVEDFSDNILLSENTGVSEPTGLKQVGWSAFHADSVSVDDDGNGFGSYSNFFSELGGSDNHGGSVGNVAGDSLNNVPYAPIGNDVHGYAYVGSSVNTGQSTGVQDFSSNLYWENQYPGWKYDPITGQWYQVDGNDMNGNAQTEVVESTYVSYMQKTVEPATGTEAETGRTGSVTNWNQETTANWDQTSQVASGTGIIPLEWSQSSQEQISYPSHIVFDPQYPGWYYDTVSQEWRALESNTELVQSTTQVQDQIHYNQQTYSAHNQGNIYDANGSSDPGQDQGWAQPVRNYSSQYSSMWQLANVASAKTTAQNHGSPLIENIYDHDVSLSSQDGQNTVYHESTGSYYENFGQGLNDFPAVSRNNQNDLKHASNSYFSNLTSVDSSMYHAQDSQISYASADWRSSAGRPAHAVVAFGFGGKLIVLKDSSSTINFYSGNQNPVRNSISVLNLAEVIDHNPEASGHRLGACSYFQSLCRQCIPGPLTGGSIGTREVNKWIDERVAEYNSTDTDYRKSEVLNLLLSLLKIACQYYGKLRSPYGTDAILKESDVPESAVAKLFASARVNGLQFGPHDMVPKFLQKLPSEAQMQVTAAEVQMLLVSGKKKEALQRAQVGQLWGPAIVLAAQLGDQFYAETVKQMAHCQFAAGSPLRTLCLLIAGQPADVFSADSNVISSMAGAANMPQQPLQFGSSSMLDDWAENLSVITANRTKDDQLVLMHLGDCLWKERSDIIAAHICYLVAEASIEQFSDTARMCLIGADHWNFPRTYASPEAIQRTEIYEYSKTLGNSQFVLLPFQPYKLIYAHMLVEVGKISDALKYCQVVLKSIKAGRTPEVESLRHLVSSLEERIKSHQQGGFSANLAPKKLVGALINLFDSTAHRVVGSMPPPMPTAGSNANDHENYQLLGPRVSTSQPALVLPSLVPSQSLEPLNDRVADNNQNLMRTSVSEPNFGSSPMQDRADSLKEASSAGMHDKASKTGGTSRFGRFGFGSQLLQKTVGLVLKPRQGKQAKLGETNKFYYDEKLKRWVEEGAETPVEEAALPPPPTTAIFPNGTSDYRSTITSNPEAPYSSGFPDSKISATSENNLGMPPLPPTSNQYSALGRMGVRSRYVDTFNKGGGTVTNFLQTPATSTKAPSGAAPKFFVPSPVSFVEPKASVDNTQVTGQNLMTSPTSDLFVSPVPAPPPSAAIQRFSSMNNISNQGAANNSSFPSHSRRVASWSGSSNNSLSTPQGAEVKQRGGMLSTHPSTFAPRGRFPHSSIDGSSSGDELHEVEL